MNLLPNHKPQIKEFTVQKALQIQLNQQAVIEGAKSLLSSGDSNISQRSIDTVEIAKIALVKEIVATPKETPFDAPPLVEKIRTDIKQEQQRLLNVEAKYLQQQQQHQRDNQRTL